MEQNDKNLQGIYNTLKKEGYNPPLYDVFVKDMQDDNNLQGVRNTLVKHGYTPPEFDEFKADMFGTPAPKSTPAHQQQANLATAAGTIPASVSSPVQPAEQPAPVQSAPEKPSWQPSEQEKIRMPYQMHTMLNDFNQKSKERIGQIQRLSEPLTPEGRQKRRALEFQAQLAGSPTKVLGLTPRTNATVPDGEQGGVVEGAAQQQPEQSGQSPVPYGVKYIDGKPVTQWLLPDGRLTTSLMEADQAEYGARTARQATSISFQIQKAETELAELQKQYEDSKSRVQEEWAEEHKRNKAPLAAVLASRTYVPRQHGDKGNSALLVAIRQKEEQIKDLIEERDRQSGKDVGFWRGFGRIVSDFRTWDLGMGDLSDAMTMLNAKHYSSPKATEDERKAGEAMMKALYDRQETENLYGGNTSWWNRAGGMTGHMPAFILDFALTGGGYGSVAKVGAKTAAKQSVKLFGKRAIEEMAGLGVKEYAKQYGVRGVGRMAGNWTVKALGTTTDDLLVRAPLMANTIQGGKTAADIIDRKLGDVVIDENGNYDFSNDKTWGSAVWQGEANSIIENYSEMFGSHIDGLTPMLAKTFGGKRISGMLARANASGFGQVLNTTRKQFQHLGVSDYIGEVAEEYYGQLWRTMLNLDDAYTDVPIFDEQGNPMIDEHGNPVTGRKNLLFTGQFHGDIWGGMALSMGLMGAGKYTLTGVGYANMKREVNKVDRMASQVLGHDEWEVLRETIDNTTNEDMGALAENVINDSSLSEEERAAVMVYMERSLNLRGLNLATLAKNRGAETDGPVTLEDVYQPNPHTDGETSSHFTPEQADAQRLYSEGRELYGRFEDSDPTVQADVDAISLRMQEAYQAVEDVFGAEAEYYMFHVNENPWALVNDPELTAEQQDAVLYYINAKAALDGVMDASNEAADRKRAEVEQSVGKRTHKDKGVIIPAETKMGKQVYIVKGDIVMFPDGSAVDVRNSSESVVVMDSQTGEYEFTSPDQIFQVSEAVNPQDELDTALSVIEQEQMSVFGQNAIAPEEPAEGEAPIDQSADVSPEPAPETASTEEYDRGYEQGLEDAAKADDAWIANLIKIYSQNTPESMPETMKGRLDAFLYEQQRRAQSVPETPENVPNPTENAISDTEIVPEAVSNVENGQQTALSRIPLNEQGEPRFEAVDKDTAWDGLVEAVGGETDAADIAMAQVQQASTDLEALKKKQPTQKAPKLKGSPMAMAQAKREAAEQYQRDLAQYNQQIADTEARLATWNGIVGVYTSRNAELRRQQEEERRQRDAIAHDEAVARFEEEQRIKAEKKAEQERIGVHAVNPKIRERWESAPKVEGNEDALTLPDGSTISGRYILTEALQKDLAEKEAKYAEIDAETEEADGIVFTSGVEDDADEFFTKDEGKFRDGDGMTYGERLRAIRALEPISVERNNLSRSELREVYSNLPSVEKDGREIGFYHSAFKKIYKEGGLFGQVVPVLDEVLGQSVLAYSEEDNLGGKVRPDGTIHKNHPNVESFDNYVGKIKLDGRDYYVRTTVKREIGQAGTHSFFITDVELYEKTVVGLTLPNFPSGESSLQRPVNPIESRTIPITSRGTTDIDGIVDAKLLKFFERASLEALELDKKDRVEELSDRLGIPVRVITKAEEIDELPSARHRRSKGYWRSKDGVVIILPNNNDVADVDNTFVHEVVGHKGLRGLIGEGRFDEFLSEVYSHASNPIRKVIDKKTDGMVNAEADRLRVRKAQAHERAGKDVNANYYTDMAEARVEAEAKRKDFRKEATEEYMADLAGRIGSEGFEKMSRDELTLWGKIKAKVQSFLDKFLSGLKIAKSIRLNDKDLSYILFKSWKNMRDKQGKGGVFADAEDAVMRHRTGWGEAMLSESAKIEDANNRFNKELQRQVDGNLPDGHIYQLGMPSNILRSTGVPNLPIQMSATRLRAKATEYGHDFDLAEIRNLVKELQTPMAVFAYGNKGKMQNIIVGIESNGKQFIVGLSLNPIVNGKALEINSVRNVFPKHNAEWLNWISQGKLLYADKQKIQALIDKQRTILADVDYLDLEDVAKVIKTFENPTFDGDEDVRFRDGADYVERVPVMARAMYEKQIQSSMYQFTEAMQDSMRGLMEFYKAVESQGAKRDIEDVSSFENAYIAENLMSSKSHAEMDEYEHRILRPLLDIAARMSGDKRGREELLDYMMAKHGLERNAYMRNEAIANGEESERDFAGLCGLTGETDWQNAEIVAQQMVDDYEAAHSTDIPALWSAVNKATKTSLQKIYNCGLISKAQYEKIRDMYNFYIPLQGFDEKTSDDVYGYLTSKKGAFSSPIKKAEGRKSKADDPLATIAYMAQNSIIQGNRNVMKQKFLTYVQNHPSDLASVNKLWLVHDEITDTWKPVFADVDENMTPDEIDKVVMDFEERMESLSQSEPDKYKRGRDAIGIPYRIVDGNIKEHQVVVKRNGESYVITINGNPRAAQAVNGLTNPDNDLNGAIGKVFNIASTVNRELSQLYTTRNPDFVVSNFIRDLIYSNTMVHVKENQGYAMRFHKNHAKVNPIRMVELLHLYEANKLDMRNPMHRMFYEFMHWGGETGYTLQRNLEQEKKLVSKIMKEARRGQLNPMSILGLIGNNLDQINRAVENSARFAAFITSREVGRDVQRSAYDAKEISVNFNKKGAGSKFMDATGQTFAGKAAGFTSGLGRSFYVFWNAAIQGTANFGKAFRKHPVKSITAATSLLLLGYIMALLADDGDDEDKNGYYNVPKYTRRSNLMFRFGEQWLTIPLPVEYRAIYGLGELAYSVTSGREEYSDAELAKETASQLSQLLPLDFMEGGGGLHAFVPSAFKPMVETATNTSWTGLPIYKNTPFNKNMPEWTKAYPRTNTQLVELSRWANEASGGNNYAAGWANFNPAQLEYLLNGYFGGYSNVINKMVKTGETMLGEREYDPSSILLVNRLVKMGDERTAEKKINSDFFKYLEEYRRTHTLLRKYEDEAERGSDRYSIFLDALKHSRDGARHDVMDEYITDYNWLNRATKDSEIADEERATYEEEMRRLKREVVSLMKVAHDSVQVNKMKERFAEEYIQQ